MADVLMRGVPDSFKEALAREERPSIDVAEARRQHDAYRSLLEAAGHDVTMVPADPDHPDCPFIEDTCVVLGNVAVITRPGALSRRGEVGPVAQALEPHKTLAVIEAPGTLDGGDVLRMGDVLFVGRSSRSNDAGIAQLASLASRNRDEVRRLDVTGVLHLKSAALRLDHETVLVARGHVDAGAFGAYRIIEIAPGEEHAASALPLGDGRVAVTAAAPQTQATLQAAGYDVVPLDVSQFQVADGGLTCLSVFL